VPGQDLPQASGIAFARSRNLYVSLLGPNQIAALDPAGTEIGRISSPFFRVAAPRCVPLVHERRVTSRLAPRRVDMHPGRRTHLPATGRPAQRARPVWDIERRTGELRDARGDALAGAFARHAECLGNGPLLTRSIPMAT
jgi:hypothetical protein